jgi:hypothetical protein
MSDRGTLEEGEFHPAASDAWKWLCSNSYIELTSWLGAFSSCAIEGNRLAEICAETLNRFLNKEPVSDRYLLGLVYTMRHAEDKIKKGLEGEDGA